MVGRVTIFSGVLVFCSILPPLASAFPQFKPRVLLEDDSGSSFTPNEVSPLDRKNHFVFPGLDAILGGSGSGNANADASGNAKGGANGQPEIALDQVEGLSVGFYETTCPRAEQIVKDILTKASLNDSGLPAALVRLHAHDCFVQGCDGSILLDQDPSGKPVEKVAGPNGVFIRGTELVGEIKAELEKECPGVVSCADILTYAARDALVLSGLPSYNVPGGRRDGVSSLEENVIGNLPLPDDFNNKIIDLFASKGLTMEEMVALTGAHSIGAAHCVNFAYRTVDQVKVKEIDPRLTAVIRFICADDKSTLPFDSITQYQLDSYYYKQLLQNKGLLESDQFMANDLKTRVLVEKFANDQNQWFKEFAAAMVKMSKIEVLAGDAGQIRKQCQAVN